MIETKNTLKVINMLRKYTDKKVFVKDIKELSNDPVFSGAASYLGATYNGPDSIIVYLNLSYQHTCEATFIHEILHIILDYEGFPNIIINEDVAKILPSQFARVLPKLQSFFSSTVDHPEIFKRMESDFDLDLSLYYEIQVQQKLNRFYKSLASDSKTNEQYYFFRQQDILIGLEYFFYPQNHKEKILKVFRESYPDAYAWGAPQSIVKAVVFAVIAVFRKNGFLHDKGSPPDKIYAELIEKFGYIGRFSL